MMQVDDYFKHFLIQRLGKLSLRGTSVCTFQKLASLIEQIIFQVVVNYTNYW